MPAPIRILLGIAAILPAILMAMVVGSGVLPTAEEMETRGMGAFIEAWQTHAMHVSLLTMAVTVVFIVLAYRSGRVPRERRLLWAVLLVFGGPVTFLAFWWLYCWDEGPPLPGWRL